jgi:peptidoglycan/xylan/chitin deacetylase (PgdA/CDA1 family)
MKSKSRIFTRLCNRWQRQLAHSLGCSRVTLRNSRPIISFTFDDFPRSALQEGGAILETAGVRATYYVSLGLMNQQIPAGPAFTEQDLHETLARGHELGCHTYAHCHSWDTHPAEFEASVVRNQQELQRFFPAQKFKSMSYPIAWPRPGTKRRSMQHVACCRAGGEGYNRGEVDAALLQASFLEKHQGELDWVKRLVDASVQEKGWLIFATHDVGRNPTGLGCETGFFTEVVHYAAGSGAKILPVAQAWQEASGSGR